MTPSPTTRVAYFPLTSTTTAQTSFTVSTANGTAVYDPNTTGGWGTSFPFTNPTIIVNPFTEIDPSTGQPKSPWIPEEKSDYEFELDICDEKHGHDLVMNDNEHEQIYRCIKCPFELVRKK